jgi:hypothetical protein
MESLGQRIAEHRRKVLSEMAKDLPNEGLIRYWRREIRAFEIGLARAERKRRDG